MFENPELSYLVMGDAEIEALNLSEEQRDEIYDYRHELFLKLLRKQEPVVLLTDYLEAKTGVLFTDGFEDEFGKACESIKR
jgi:hypothetical protein